MSAAIPLDITFVSHDAGRAGAQRILLTLIRWLRDHRGVRPAIILRRGGPLISDFRELGPVLEVEPLLERDSEEFAAEILGFSGKPDLIYINTLVPGDIGAILSSLKIPIITHAHEMEHAIRRWCAPEHLAALLKVTSRFITASPPVAETLQRSYGIDPERMDTIYEFVRCSQVELGTWSKTEVRKSRQLPEDGFIFFGCGTMDWRKGPDLFVEVAQRTIQNFHRRNAYFFWIGGASSPEEDRDLRATIAAAGLSDHIQLLGEVADPTAYFAAGDAFVLTSREDPYPLVCLEAADCGLPIICFDQIGGIPEFVGADAGYVVPFGNTQAMAEKISHLCESPEEGGRRGAVACRRVRSQHDVSVAGEQIMGVILSVLLKQHRQALRSSADRIKQLEAKEAELAAKAAGLETTIAAQYQSLVRNREELDLLRAEKDGFTRKVSALETEQTALGKRMAEFEATVTALRQVLSQRDLRISSLESDANSSDQKVAELESGLSDANTSIVERNLKIAALEAAQSGILWNLLCGVRKSKDCLLPTGSRRRRFYDHGLALLKGGTPGASSQNGQEMNSIAIGSSSAADIVYSIDSLALRAGRVYGWGWLLHKTRPVTGLGLVARTVKGISPLRCQYGVRRDDVGLTQGFSGSQNSGFLILSRLPREEIIELFLEVELSAGEVFRIDCQDLQWLAQRSRLDAPSVPNRGFVHHLQKFSRYGQRGMSYLTRRDWKGLHDTVQKKLQESRLFGTPLPKFSPQEFLNLLGPSRNREFVLLVDHNLGGGANQYRAQVVRENLEKNRPVLFLSYNLWRLQYSIQYIDRDRDLAFDVESLDAIFSLSPSVRIKEIFLNNTVSFDDPLAFAMLLPQLRRASGAELTVALHDYFALCPSWNLLDNTGRHCGVPNLERCRECLPNLGNALSFWVDAVSIDQWRKSWGECLHEATTILCFSRASVELLRRAYPDLDGAKIKHLPHSIEDFPHRKLQGNLGPGLHIGVVGEITLAKGAGIIQEMARLISERRLPIKITVIGTIEGLANSDIVSITGPYQRQDLPATIERSQANVFLVPSIWPETFSYVTAELMAMEVPVAVFALGAQAERVAGYHRGLVIEKIDGEEALERLIGLYAKLRENEDGSTGNHRFA